MAGNGRGRYISKANAPAKMVAMKTEFRRKKVLYIPFTSYFDGLVWQQRKSEGASTVLIVNWEEMTAPVDGQVDVVKSMIVKGLDLLGSWSFVT